MKRTLTGTAIFVTVVIACLSGYYVWNANRLSALPALPQVPQIQQPAPMSDQGPAKSPPIEPAPTASVIPLPDLEASDKVFGDALIKLMGGNSLPALFYPNKMISRIVATIDNLPRRHAPARMWPVRRAAKGFLVSASIAGLAIDPRNAARYAPYMDVVQSIAVAGLVDVYLRFYPLFQQAYQELGYPKGYFNNHLIEALDDMLAAPELGTSARLVQPKVLYEFAEADLEERSAGQKIMLRIGSSNEARVKSMLRAIRSEVMRRLSNK